MSFTAVIFDCDGVLVDSEPLANAILAELLTEIGLPTTAEESMRDFKGRPWAYEIAVVTERLGASPPADFEQRYRARLFDAYATSLRPVTGIAAALDEIALPRCIASSSDHARIRRSLAAAGLLERFADDAIFSTTDVVNGKPAPDLFLHAAERMGFDPASTVVIEDSTAGVEAGIAAGMPVLGYAERTPAEQLRAAGATTFRAMTELPGLLSAGAARE